METVLHNRSAAQQTDTPRAWFPVNREEGTRECLSRFTSTCDKLQCGLQLDDFKPMLTIDKGVEEIRIRDDSGIYRVPYRARFADAVFVLHAFEKKMQRTSQRDIAIAKARFSEMMRDRVSRFSLDALVNIAAAIGPRVHMEPV